MHAGSSCTIDKIVQYITSKQLSAMSYTLGNNSKAVH